MDGRPVGYVYGMQNPYFPELVKIGLTTIPIEHRLRGMYGTSVPGEYSLRFCLTCFDVDRSEKLVHDALAYCRESPKKEFFRVAPEHAEKVARAVLTEHGLLTSEPLRRYHPPARDIPSEASFRRFGWPIVYGFGADDKIRGQAEGFSSFDDIYADAEMVNGSAHILDGKLILGRVHIDRLSADQFEFF